MSKFICNVSDKFDGWEWEKDEIIDCVCQDLPYFSSHEGKDYCVLHYPNYEKQEEFERTLSERLSHSVYNFRAVWFPDAVNLSNTVFDSPLNFSDAFFGGKLDLSHSKFIANADFRGAEFMEKVNFFSTTFSGEAFFDLAKFNKEAVFWKAIFEENTQIFFNSTTFSGYTDFHLATFKGYIHFEGNQIRTGENVNQEIVFKGDKVFLDLQQARLEKPERISFHTVRLHPSWFINTDPKKFILTNIYWEDANQKSQTVKSELEHLNKRQGVAQNKFQLLKIAYRQLAENAETNNRFEEASKFRQMAFETEWLERKESFKNWKNDFAKIFGDGTECKNIISATSERTKRFGNLLKSHPFDFVHFLYYWLSAYGEKWFRAFGWLFAIWIGFAMLYWLFGKFGIEGKDFVSFGKSFGYSLLVMTLQKPEPRPYDWITYLFYGLETIFAPIQAALLALAIRRKFMR